MFSPLLPIAAENAPQNLAVNTATSDVQAVEFASSSDGDGPELPALLDHIPDVEKIGTVTADGAYDTRLCRTAFIDRQATAISAFCSSRHLCAGLARRTGTPGRHP